MVVTDFLGEIGNTSTSLQASPSQDSSPVSPLHSLAVEGNNLSPISDHTLAVEGKPSVLQTLIKVGASSQPS